MTKLEPIKIGSNLYELNKQKINQLQSGHMLATILNKHADKGLIQKSTKKCVSD